MLRGRLPNNTANIMLQDSINIAKVLKREIDIILLSILLIYACHDTQIVTITYNVCCAINLLKLHNSRSTDKIVVLSTTQDCYYIGNLIA